jgi:hypothetical protein
MKFDVLLRSIAGRETDYPVKPGLNVAPIGRTVESVENGVVTFTKRRVGSKGDERAGLTEDEIEKVKKNFQGKNLPDLEYRKVPGRSPLFLIYFVNIENAKTPLVVPAYGISFPGDPGSSRRPAKLVEYVVNTKWWEQNYGIFDEEAEEES